MVGHRTKLAQPSRGSQSSALTGLGILIRKQVSYLRAEVMFTGRFIDDMSVRSSHESVRRRSLRRAFVIRLCQRSAISVFLWVLEAVVVLGMPMAVSPTRPCISIRSSTGHPIPHRHIQSHKLRTSVEEDVQVPAVGIPGIDLI